MTDATQEISGLGTSSAPLTYTVADAEGFDLAGVRATFDGTGAGGAFLPCVQILSPAGHVMAQTIGSSVLAGGSADVTFAPFLTNPSASTTTGGGGFNTLGLTNWQSGCYYGPQWAQVGNTFVAAAGETVVYPIWVPTAVSIAGISVYVINNNGVDSIRVGLWADNGSGYPSTFLQAAGYDTIAANGEHFFNHPFNLASGVYWLGAEISGNVLEITAFVTPGQIIASSSNLTALRQGMGPNNYNASGFTGFVNPFPAGKTNATFARGPGVWLKTA